MNPGRFCLVTSAYQCRNSGKTVGGATGVQGRIWDPLGRTFIGRQRTSVHELRKFSGRAGEQLTCTRFIVEGGKRTLRSSWVCPNLRLWRRHSLKIWGNLCRYTGRDAVWFRTSGLTQTCPEMITALDITGCLGFNVRAAPCTGRLRWWFPLEVFQAGDPEWDQNLLV